MSIKILYIGESMEVCETVLKEAISDIKEKLYLIYGDRSKKNVQELKEKYKKYIEEIIEVDAKSLYDNFKKVYEITNKHRQKKHDKLIIDITGASKISYLAVLLIAAYQDLDITLKYTTPSTSLILPKIKIEMPSKNYLTRSKHRLKILYRLYNAEGKGLAKDEISSTYKDVGAFKKAINELIKYKLIKKEKRGTYIITPMGRDILKLNQYIIRVEGGKQIYKRPR